MAIKGASDDSSCHKRTSNACVAQATPHQQQQHAAHDLAQGLLGRCAQSHTVRHKNDMQQPTTVHMPRQHQQRGTDCHNTAASGQCNKAVRASQYHRQGSRVATTG